MTRTTQGTVPARPGAGQAGGRAGRAAGWLRAGRSGLFVLALVVGAGAGLGAVIFRYLIYFITWLATGHVEFGQQGHVGSAHFPWLGLAFFVVIPVIGGLLYGPLIYSGAREARGHGVPEVMDAIYYREGVIRPIVVRRRDAHDAPRRRDGGGDAQCAPPTRVARRRHHLEGAHCRLGRREHQAVWRLTG